MYEVQYKKSIMYIKYNVYKVYCMRYNVRKVPPLGVQQGVGAWQGGAAECRNPFLQASRRRHSLQTWRLLPLLLHFASAVIGVSFFRVCWGFSGILVVFRIFYTQPKKTKTRN